MWSSKKFLLVRIKWFHYQATPKFTTKNVFILLHFCRQSLTEKGFQGIVGPCEEYGAWQGFLWECQQMFLVSIDSVNSSWELILLRNCHADINTKRFSMVKQAKKAEQLSTCRYVNNIKQHEMYSNWGDITCFLSVSTRIHGRNN